MANTILKRGSWYNANSTKAESINIFSYPSYAPTPFSDPSNWVGASKEFVSNLSKGTRQGAKLCITSLKCLFRAAQINFYGYSETLGGYGNEANRAFFVGEWISSNDFFSDDAKTYSTNTVPTACVAFIPSSASMQSSYFLAGTIHEQRTKDTVPYDETKHNGTAIMFSLFGKFLDDEEFAHHFAIFNEAYKKYMDFGIIDDDWISSAFICCDNMYRQSFDESLGIKEAVYVKPLSKVALEGETYAPDVKQGNLHIFGDTPSNDDNSVSSIVGSSLQGVYAYTERVLTKAEQTKVPTIPNWYIVPPQLINLLKHAQGTTAMTSPMRNFLLRGPAGTGKTETARAYSAATSLPYVKLTCGANTEIFDLFGQMMPTESLTQQNGYTPSIVDITLVPSDVYMKLTGIEKSDASSEEVLNILLERAKGEKEKGQQQFRYIESDLVKAIRYGYVCELQEPTAISNPGVLVQLNSLFDTDASITLPTGETIKRHPDCTLILTTNEGYAGTRPLNQSVISRMDLISTIETPQKATIMERIRAITGADEKTLDAKTLSDMVDIFETIQEYCKTHQIDSGSVGMRELISWATSTMITGKLLDSCIYTILESSSSYSEERTEIFDSCLKPKFQF